MQYNSSKNTDSNTEESKRVFNNEILHFLSKNHISIPLMLFFGGGLVLCFISVAYFSLGMNQVISYFILGFLFFTLLEYLIHRFLYHLPNVYKEGHLPFVLHGIHHKYPKDKKRLVMPPILSVILSAIILGVNYLLFGNYSLPFTAGLLVGYAAYLSVHYAVHAFKPPQNFLKQLWVNHSVHHYKNDEKAFGVSSPLWDYVFGTMPKNE